MVDVIPMDSCWDLKPVEFFGFLIDWLKQLKPVEFENIFFVFLSCRKNLWTGLSHIIIHWLGDPCPILANWCKLLLCIKQVNMCELNQVHTSVYFQTGSGFIRREMAWLAWFEMSQLCSFLLSFDACITKGALIWESQLFLLWTCAYWGGCWFERLNWCISWSLNLCCSIYAF
jgi:hypothetical protein